MIKKFEAFNELDPYGEENWEDDDLEVYREAFFKLGYNPSEIEHETPFQPYRGEYNFFKFKTPLLGFGLRAKNLEYFVNDLNGINIYTSVSFPYRIRLNAPDIDNIHNTISILFHEGETVHKIGSDFLVKN